MTNVQRLLDLINQTSNPRKTFRGLAAVLTALNMLALFDREGAS